MWPQESDTWVQTQALLLTSHDSARYFSCHCPFSHVDNRNKNNNSFCQGCWEGLKRSITVPLRPSHGRPLTHCDPQLPGLSVAAHPSPQRNPPPSSLRTQPTSSSPTQLGFQSLCRDALTLPVDLVSAALDASRPRPLPHPCCSLSHRRSLLRQSLSFFLSKKGLDPFFG